MMADLTATSYDSIMTPYMPVFYVSFLATLMLTPLMRKLAHRHGIVDDPDGRRKVHTQPIAYLGGVSIFLGWLAGVSVSVFLKPHNADVIVLQTIQVPPGVLLGAATVVLFGLLDDVYSLSPKIKLFGQLLAALLLVGPGALGIGGSDFFLGLHGNHTGPGSMILDSLIRNGLASAEWATSPGIVLAAAAFSTVAAIFIIVATCNATNLLDGLDGLCSGVTGVMSIGYLILAVYLAHKVVGTSGGSPIDPTRITLSLALLGAVLGFLPFNFNPASIFMGDTGSMFLGYICGTMILLFAQNQTVKWCLAGIIMFGLPMMDTFLAIVRRKLNGKPIFSPDSNHFHHFLVKRGLSVRKAVLLSYLVAAVFVSFALVIVIVQTRLAIGVYLVLFGWIIVAAFKMGMIFQNAPVASNSQLNISVLKPSTEGTAKHDASSNMMTTQPTVKPPAEDGGKQDAA
jgi:UDP-GlcNAc:undecaprenyl-phosphate/decaprenyl-phosphate GlcNAc-1-phosphate transferase